MTDRATGRLLLFARATEKLYVINERTAAVTEVNTLAGADLASIADDDAVNGCPGSIVQFGAGCLGSGGFVPELDTSGCATPGSMLSLSISNALGGSTATLLFGLGQGQTPLGYGCNLLLSPMLSAPQIVAPLNGWGPGGGYVNLVGALPSNVPPSNITMQAWVLDTASPALVAGSNGLQLTIE